MSEGGKDKAQVPTWGEYRNEIDARELREKALQLAINAAGGQTSDTIVRTAKAFEEYLAGPKPYYGPTVLINTDTGEPV